jgi:hypothetical protein
MEKRIFKYANHAIVNKKLITLIAIILSSSASYAQCLVADYQFSGNANDQTANANNGTVNGASLTTDRNNSPNTAYNFPTGNEYIVANPSTSLNTANFPGVTMSTWFYMTGVASSPFNPHIYHIADITPDDSYGIIYEKATQKIRYLNWNGTTLSGNVDLQGTTNIALNTWYHVAVTHDHSTNAVKLYLNGVVEAQTTATANFPVNPNLTIGRHRTNANSGMKGKIDEVKLFNCALTATEVAALYNPVPPPAGCQVAIYNFSGNADDQTTYGNNGTVYGASLTTDRNGNANSAFNFPTGNDYIVAPPSASLNTANYTGFTMSTWFYMTGIVSGSYNPHIFHIADITPDNSYGIIYVKSTQKLHYLNWKGSTLSAQVALNSSTSAALNTWYHVAVTHDHVTNAVKMYVNGVLEAQTNATANFPVNPNLTIGRHRTNANSGMIGKIDEVKLFNCALTPSEIAGLAGISTGMHAINAAGISSISVYPNPAKNSFMLSHQLSGNTEIVIYSSSGKQVFSKQSTAADESIDMSDHSAGLYFVMVRNEAAGVLWREKIVLTE